MIPSLVPFIQVTQFDPQKRRLQFIETAVRADRVVFVFASCAVVAQQTQAFGDFGILRGDRAAVAECAEVLSGIEAETGTVAEAADAPAAITRPVRLSGVLDDLQTTLSGNVVDGVGVGRLAV